MAARNNPSQGHKPDKLMRDALLVVLHRAAVDADGKPTKRLNNVAAAIVTRAEEGDVAAIKEIFDRVDGRTPQAIIGGAPGEEPITIVTQTPRQRATALAFLLAKQKAD